MSMNGEEWRALQVNIKEYFERVLLERDKAIAIQTRELERRLGELNGEAGRLREMQARYVPREVNDVKVAELERSLQSIERRMAVVSAGAALLASGVTAAMVRWLSQ